MVASGDRKPAEWNRSAGRLMHVACDTEMLLFLMDVLDHLALPERAPVARLCTKCWSYEHSVALIGEDGAVGPDSYIEEPPDLDTSRGQRLLRHWIDALQQAR